MVAIEAAVNSCHGDSKSLPMHTLDRKGSQKENYIDSLPNKLRIDDWVDRFPKFDALETLWSSTGFSIIETCFWQVEVELPENEQYFFHGRFWQFSHLVQTGVS
jgi:hypothetical protein